MKHVIFGGDGFVGRYLARDLLALGEEVVVCDIRKSDLPIYPGARFVHTDITDVGSVAQAPVDSADIVYNLAARMLHPIVPLRQRHDYFFSVDYQGGANVLDFIIDRGCRRHVLFSTDMVYGKMQTPPPIRPDHPRETIGEYSGAKRELENLCIERRSEGLRVSILRPRIIIGPGRLGILINLFRLVEKGLPLPMIGDGSNHYQMISVFDCASAAVCAWKKGLPDGEFNLGSRNPPTVRQLLTELTKEAGSRSFLVRTPASLVKSTLRFLDRINLSLLVPEQYEIADSNYVLDISDTERVLEWTPRYDDTTMMLEAYREYKQSRLDSVHSMRFGDDTRSDRDGT